MKLCLVTHHKAGTHWSKYFLANYVALIETEGKSPRINFDEMEKKYFPIRIDKYFSDSKSIPIYPILNHTKSILNIEAMYWAHFNPKQKTKFMEFDKVVLQCRNPLDFLVSKFHYDLKRLNLKAKILNSPPVLSPWDLHPKSTEEWCNIFSSMVELSQLYESKFKIISYEELKFNSKFYFNEMLNHFFNSVDMQYLIESISRSSIEKSREDEIERKKPIVGHTYSSIGDGYASGSFARSGEIGQFTKYFDDSQKNEIMAFIEDKLGNNLLIVFNKLFANFINK